MLTTLFGRSAAVAPTPAGGSDSARKSNSWSINEVPERFAAKVVTSAADVERELARVTQKMESLLPIETALKPRFEFEVACLRAEQVALDRRLDARFKRLHMGFMRLNKGNNPAFALFDVAGPPECYIRIESRFRQPTAQNHGEWVAQCTNATMQMWQYANLQPLKDEVLQRHSAVELWTTLTGVIPDDVRLLINQCKADFDQIALVAEVTEWQKLLRSNDPLVIGRVGPLWWLIAKFDTTPFEAYVSKEFTTEH
jgi:hypothetical protein